MTNTDNMDINYAVVKLMRCDDPLKSNNERVDSVVSNNTTVIDVSNQTTEVKRNTRLSRKRTFRCKSVTEDCDQADDIKKKKCMAKKPQSNKTEPVGLIISQKDVKKPKCSISVPVKPSKNSSTNSDLNLSTISDTISTTIHIDNEIPKSMQNSLKTTRNKKSRSITTNKKNILVTNVNKDDTSNEVEKNEKPELLKIPKSKISKSNIPAKKRYTANNVFKYDIPNEDLINDNSVSLKPTKNKPSKSNTTKKSFVMNNLNNSNVSINLEESNNLTPPKISKNKSSTKSSVKRKSVLNNVKKDDIYNEVEEKSDVLVSHKRSRSSLKKLQLPNTHVCNIFNDSEQTMNGSIVLKKQDNSQEPVLSKGPTYDSMMMLRSNDKPPKIKKKWSEEWSESKSLNTALKFHNDDHLGSPKIDLNKSPKMIKKGVRTRKSTNTNIKKPKAKMLEKLNSTTSNSILINSLNTSVPPTKTMGAVSSNVITQPINNTIITNAPLVCNKTTSLSEVTHTKPSLPSIKLPTISVELPTTSTQLQTSSTELSNNSVLYENGQPSQVITTESIFGSSYPSFPMNYSDSAEISYGIAILSEAISRQSRESNEKSTERTLPEQDINEIQSSSKKTNGGSRLQVPSAIVSPQKVTENKNMSKEVVNYSSEPCEPSVETESRAEREIILLSKRFNIPVEALRKTVIEDPLSVFRKKYSETVTPSMITISPIVKSVETKTKPCTDYLSGSLDVEYQVEPIREAAAYEKTNLKDLMEELSKTMPSWSLSIVTNPSRYVIANMSINTYGVPSANKVIVFDRFFRASVYINQTLDHSYCKPYTTATEIVNLIKELNSI